MTAPHPADPADPGRSAWVSANAGAGKTYTLANRVARLLLDGAKPEKILCLTYTKAAAAEMEGRLFQQLGQWSMADDDALAQRIRDIGGGERDADGLRVARRLFAQALETPGGLKIQTIHSFCQYLLARFPLEAGVAPSFRVLDDATARELRDEARARVLTRAGRNGGELADAAATLVTETSERTLESILQSAFGSDRRKLERFLARLPEAVLHDAVRAAHGAEAGDTVAGVEAEFLGAIGKNDAKLLDIIAWLGNGTTNDKKLMEKLAAAKQANAFAAFGPAFLTNSGEPRKQLATRGRIAEAPDLFDGLTAIATAFLAADERRRAAHATALAQAALILMRAARDEYEAAKKMRGALDYNDLIMATRNLLERRAAAQWVLYKLDGGLDHVLIDEAQDTSPEQWAIVERLTEEFFAGEGIDADRKSSRTIFAVGDEKQSIFSFQGAEPREFEAHRHHFSAQIGDAFIDARLETSRRSVPQVLEFVDRVFAPAEAREGVVSEDAPIAHVAHRRHDKGCVELWPLVCPTETPEPDPWRPVDTPSQASPVVRLAEQIADRIDAWTDGRTCIPGHKKAIRPGDIMVLMPRREPFATALIRALKARGVPVAGADRIRLAEQIAVMDLIALGRFALLPEDDLNLAALLRSPLAGFSDAELYALSVGRDGLSLWQSLVARRADAAHNDAAFAFLSATRARADYAPPYEFYAAFLSTPGVRQRLLTRLGAEASDAIDEFLSLALSYEALNTPSLEGFLHWIERGEAEAKRDMDRGRNEVRVMTVHGAKGLEADIVILPDTAGAPGGSGRHGDILYTDDGPVFPVRAEIAPEAVRRAKADAERKAREEHRRLLYVALTRARDRLYICGFRGQKQANANSWYALAQRAAEEIGVPVVERGETLHAFGSREFERIDAPGPASHDTIAPEDWMVKPAPEERERPRLIRPSDAAGMDAPAALSPVGARNARRFRRGNLVHALLARLPELDPALRRSRAEAYLAAQQLPPGETAPLIEETLRVMDGVEFAPAFAPAARAEVAIVADLPELGEGARVSGRIDRLAISDAEVLAVDFKTNRPPPGSAAEIPALYLSQIALYRAALARIFPRRRIACALVWTDGPTLMRLDDALLDAEIGRIGARFGQSGFMFGLRDPSSP